MALAGKPNEKLVQLWRLAFAKSKTEGLSYEESVAFFREGYDGFPPTATPWVLLTAEAISGFSAAGGDGAAWMLRTAGAAFAAYGVKPKFK